jgi:DNA-directed RNA polymerase subunit RPC12/RpoP
MLMDEKTVDSDPLISQAIGGVKVLVHNDDLEKAARLYNDIRIYEKDEEGGEFSCPSCKSTRILVAPTQRKNIFYMLFPFFEKRKHICNDCKTIF